MSLLRYNLLKESVEYYEKMPAFIKCSTNEAQASWVLAQGARYWFDSLAEEEVTQEDLEIMVILLPQIKYLAELKEQEETDA